MARTAVDCCSGDRPSSWPVRRERRRHAHALESKRLHDIEASVHETVLRVDRLEALLLRTAMPDFEELDKRISQLTEPNGFVLGGQLLKQDDMKEPRPPGL